MKLNDDLKTFLSVASYILFTFLIGYIDNPIISCIPLALWLLYLMYVSYQNVVYRLGKANYLLFPTYNDGYIKVSKMVIGLLLLIGCGLWIGSESDMGVLLPTIGSTIGGLMLFNGIYNLPNCMIEISGNEMLIAGHDAAMSISEIKQIELQQKCILVRFINRQTVRIDNLAMDESWMARVRLYILSHAPDMVVIMMADDPKPQFINQ